jgi:diguanylate cyclase (GGDEF)-like protein
VEARDTRSEGGQRPSRLRALVTDLRGRDDAGPGRQEDTPRQDEVESRQAKRPTLLYFARLIAFGALTWTLGALLATLHGMWNSSPVPILSAALLLMVPAMLFGAALVLRNIHGSGERLEERGPREVSDTTTGLPGESYFRKCLKLEFERARRDERSLAVVVFDVNHLQSVNEQFNWSCGDEVLSHVARMIAGTRRTAGILARLDGDRFGLILPECGEDGASAFIRRLEDRLAREPSKAHFEGQTVVLWMGVCAGVAVLSPEARDPREFLSLAEADLRLAKEHLKERRERWLSA